MNFKIGFESEDTKKLHQMWDDIIYNQKWSEGKYTQLFEDKWTEREKQFRPLEI